jgi:transposase-like protein
MAKYSLELKLQAVLAYLDGKGSFQTIAERFQVSLSPLKNWVNHYREHGVKGFQQAYTNHDLRFKMDVLNYMRETRASIEKTASIFNVGSSNVWKWKQLFEAGGVDALQQRKKGRPSMNKKDKKNQPEEGSVEALRAENERLRMENEYLKKLQALIQQKEKLQNKTKRK